MKLFFSVVIALFIIPALPAFRFTQPTAQQLIDKAIQQHGGEHYLDVLIDFDFRERHYRALKKRDGIFQYERSFTENGHQIKDVLSNDGFSRTIDGVPTELPAKKSTAYSNSVNSVIYFALLPHGLNDAAVIKEYLGEVVIKGNVYDKIRVSFKKEGGGEDHDDVFVYWIHKQDHTVDYLAYSFKENGGGLRFRSAYNRKNINGIVFQDYINYKSSEPGAQLVHLDSLYQENQLEELSKIELKNIRLSAI